MNNRFLYKITSETGKTIVDIGIEGYSFLRYYRLVFLPFFAGMLIYLTVQIVLNIPFAIFFIVPFWIAFGLMLIGNINSFKETQTIEISESTITIFKNRPIWPIKIEIARSEIVEVNLIAIEKGISLKNFNRENWLVWIKGFRNYLQLPAIRTKESINYFFEYAGSKEEKLSLLAEINEILKNQNTA